MTFLGAAATFSTNLFAATDSNSMTATPQCDGDDHGKKSSSAVPQCDGDDHGKKSSSAVPQCDGDDHGKKG
ncbi:MAG TPA: hypothetical protein VKP30_04060, partial [Polyangiaceae bacterium]|nr:hypothetical protein [Polyangiaceae bacterium]